MLSFISFNPTYRATELWRSMREMVSYHRHQQNCDSADCLPKAATSGIKSMLGCDEALDIQQHIVKLFLNLPKFVFRLHVHPQLGAIT
ncbi:hypothetical protein [Candidatus Nitrotoga sp. M5]|uniref:hypothetical protein n=1 Tax=Candidatus Nitrotoga sp. M5 TaxID=2890409 RepID=UPI001EF70AA4|nr:hypothetical protein [Candidatus Nitrotoga sp. M5]